MKKTTVSTVVAQLEAATQTSKTVQEKIVAFREKFRELKECKSALEQTAQNDPIRFTMALARFNELFQQFQTASERCRRCWSSRVIRADFLDHILDHQPHAAPTKPPASADFLHPTAATKTGVYGNRTRRAGFYASATNFEDWD